MPNPNTGRTWATMVADAYHLDGARATTCYHPDGVSWRGVAYHRGIASVCKHSHRTEQSARNCGIKTARRLVAK